MAASSPSQLIESAFASMETNKEAALDALLKAWRATNAPAIADVIDVLSRELTEHEPPIRAVGSMSAKKAWNATAEKARPASLGRLLEVLPDGNDRCLRLETLIAMDRDPRITPVVVSWLRRPPIRAHRAGFFVRVLELIEKTKDVRILKVITPMAVKTERGSTIHIVGMVNWKRVIALAEVLAKVNPKALAEADTKMLKQIRALVSKETPKLVAASDPKDFFAKVYANPDDDEARAVLSDLLQQQGDPRGEFIALQLARDGTDKARSARERELFEMWGRDWLGPLEPAILKGDVVFERGFLSRCRYAGGSEGKKTATCEEWSTVTHLDVTNASRFVGGSHELLVGKPARRAMRHVVGLAREDIAKLVGGTTLPWETLGMRMWRWRDNVDILLEGPERGPGETFKNVKKLAFTHGSSETIRDVSAPQITALLEKWPNVVELEVALLEDQIANVADLPIAKRQLERLTFYGYRCQSTYEICTKSKDLNIVFMKFGDYWGNAAAEAVARLAANKSIERINVAAPGRVKLEKDMLVRGRYEKMSIASLRTAAKNASIPLEIDV